MTVARSTALLGGALFAALFWTRPAAAQSTPTDAAPRTEVGVGVDWMGGASFGTSSANEVVASGGAFPLFTASSEYGGALGVNVKIARRLRSAFAVEASASYSRPELRSTTAADVEGAPSVTATDRLRQITIEGAILYKLDRWRVGRRGSPFLSAGAGFLRHLHEGDTFVQNGELYAFGGGVKIPLLTRDRKRLAVAGVRADVRAVVRSHGAAPDGRSHLSPALGVSAYLGFAK